ncbi:hypothetical protein GCM10017744_021190 [Streptomyces antimycoticus]
MAVGIERSGRLISAAAAAAVLVVTACFATSIVVMVKEICVGVFLAVLIDAVLVRAPGTAVMRLLGAANWWWPRFSRSSGPAGRSRPGKGGRKWRTGNGGRPEAAPEHAARLPPRAEAQHPNVSRAEPAARAAGQPALRPAVPAHTAVVHRDVDATEPAKRPLAICTFSALK